MEFTNHSWNSWIIHKKALIYEYIHESFTKHSMLVNAFMNHSQIDPFWWTFVNNIHEHYSWTVHELSHEQSVNMQHCINKTECSEWMVKYKKNEYKIIREVFIIIPNLQHTQLDIIIERNTLKKMIGYEEEEIVI